MAIINFNDPIWPVIFTKLNEADALDDKENVTRWMNESGLHQLTVCPECGQDNFAHNDGCSISDEIDEFCAEES